MGMTSLLGNSAMPQYMKVMAAGMLSLTYLGALFVEGFDLLSNVTPPAVVTFIIGTGLTTAVGVLQLHAGAQLGESPATPAGSVTLPLQQAQVTIGANTDASPPAS